MPKVYLNGDFIEESNATISVYDRGFLFADAIYEVIPVYGRKPFRAQCHLQRLDNSLQALGIDNPHSSDQWLAILDKLVSLNEADDQCIYMQISRGNTGNRDHDIPDNLAATVFANSRELAPVPAAVLERGVKAILLEDIRWQWCHIKSTALLANILLKKQATAAGANEAILHRDGRITEGASSNVFTVLNGKVITPPTNGELLPGITRAVVIEVLESISLPIEVREIGIDELRNAEEIWISSSTRELYPVTNLDGQTVTQPKPGVLWNKVFTAIQEYKHNFRQAQS